MGLKMLDDKLVDELNKFYTACMFCKYWNEFPNLKDKDLANGHCKRFPPTVTFFGNKLPITNAGDFCGEFKAKPCKI